jgi:hypothetical protein
MDNDVHTNPQDQIGKQLGAEPKKQRLDLCGKSVAEIVSILTSPPIACEDGPSSAVASPPPSDVPEPSRFTNAPLILPRIANAPRMTPGIGGPNLDLQPLTSLSLEGQAAEDIARGSSRDLSRPEPRIKTEQRPVVARFGRLSLIVTLTAIVAVGVTLMTLPNEARKRWGAISAMVTPLFEDSSRARTSTKLPHLVVKSIKGLVNEPLPLGVSINDASRGERVILAGFAIGTSLSTGTPLGLTSWQMLARDVDNVFVYAPKDFVGAIVAAIDLRSPSDWLIDSQTVRLEWIPAAREAPLR